MSIYKWKFHTIPDPKAVEYFIDAQMPLFSRNASTLTGGDGEPIVDLMLVEHNCGAVNLEFQLNGVEGQSGDVFCFPGYYPGDMDDEGTPLFNYCNTHGHFYRKIVEKILDRAQKVFDMEVTISVKKQRKFYPA
ncbi:MAG: hypothetical protein EHM33_16620 [Chloroflexi bacterium]|nr:MAG: hypothetical protein EHM33_16620 [Chloroflexota bacterium]